MRGWFRMCTAPGNGDRCAGTTSVLLRCCHKSKLSMAPVPANETLLWDTRGGGVLMAFPLLIDYFLTHLMQIAVATTLLVGWREPSTFGARTPINPGFSRLVLIFSWCVLSRMRAFWTQFKSASSAITNKSGAKKVNSSGARCVWRQK